jgi:predicted DNA-binding mobile mystery protein A
MNLRASGIMKPEFRELRIEQLERALKPFLAVRDLQRPQRGWVRAIREASGLTVRGLAKRIYKTPQVTPSRIAQLEKSEAEYRITLGSLRDAADALGCQLVYALIPKTGSVRELLERDARTQAAENVHAVEHTMALEDQAVGGVEAKIEEETKRILRGTSNK